MKLIQQTMIEEIYLQATELSRDNKQTVGERRDYYITLAQLELILGLNYPMIPNNK